MKQTTLHTILWATAAAGICLVGIAAAGDGDLRVFQSEQDQLDAGRMLIAYQKAAILAALARRDATVAALSTKEEVLERARAARAAFINSIGGLPASKCPLRPRVVGIVDRGTFTIEKVLYQSRPNFWVSANLYLPKGLEGNKTPAVLTPMGHSAEGKSARWLQERAIGLARLGYIALAYDQVGLGERWQYWDPATGLDRIGHRNDSGELSAGRMVTTKAHSYAGLQAWLVGSSLAQYVVWDAVRGVDYLLSRPEVDPRRIGCSGASMGGLATMVLTAVEPRLRVSVPVSHISKRRHLVERMIARDAEQIFLGCYSAGWDHADLLLPMVLQDSYLEIIANKEDFFPIAGARQTAGELERLFDLAGKPERFRFLETPHRHGWCQEGYEGLYRFLNTAFDRTDLPATHSVTRADTVEPEKLWCTREGQVAGGTVQSETVFSLSQDRVKQLRQQRRQARDPQRIVAAAVRRVGLNRFPADPNASKYGTTEKDGVLVEKWVIASEKGLRLPALLLRASGTNAASSPWAVVYASAGGKQTVFQPERFPLRQVLDHGGIVLAVDVRGWGETRWRKDPGRPAPDRDRYTAVNVGPEWILTYNALRNGQTMVGQRAFDLLAAARWLRRRPEITAPGSLGVFLWGDGQLGVSALHALATAGAELTGAVLCGTLASYDDWATTRFYDVPVGLVVPGILADYDLADLVWAIGVSRGEPSVTWVNAIGADGAPIDQRALRQVVAEAGSVDPAGARPAAHVLHVPSAADWNKLRCALPIQ